MYKDLLEVKMFFKIIVSWFEEILGVGCFGFCESKFVICFEKFVSLGFLKRRVIGILMWNLVVNLLIKWIVVIEFFLYLKKLLFLFSGLLFNKFC